MKRAGAVLSMRSPPTSTGFAPPALRPARSSRPSRDKRYDLLYPLLDLTTSLDPRFNIAYRFGAIFLAEPPPGGAGPARPGDGAAARRGSQAQPQRWEFAQDIGFVHYWWLHDYARRRGLVQRGREIPGAPIWLAAARRRDPGTGWQPRHVAAAVARRSRRRRRGRVAAHAGARSGCSSSTRWTRSITFERVVAAYAAADRRAAADVGRPGRRRLPARRSASIRTGRRISSIRHRGRDHARPAVTAQSASRRTSDRPRDRCSALRRRARARRPGRRQLSERLHLPAAAPGVARWPASHCTPCERTLAWYENVPVASWLAAARPLPHLRRRHRRRLSACRSWSTAGALRRRLSDLRMDAAARRAAAVCLRDDRAVRHRSAAPDPAERHHAARHRRRACLQRRSCRRDGWPSLIGAVAGGGVLFADCRGLLPRPRGRRARAWAT